MISAERIVGDRGREVEGKEDGEPEELAVWPIVTKSCTCMAIILYYFIAQNKWIFFPFGRQSSIRSFRARIKAQRIAMWGVSHQ